jgi:hypothetical protein
MHFSTFKTRLQSGHLHTFKHFLKLFIIQESSTYKLPIHSTDYYTLPLVNTKEKENLKPLNNYTRSSTIKITYHNQITQHKITLAQKLELPWQYMGTPLR